MRKLQLFIGSERIDLFKDESVSITQSIQNVRDIEKIFTSFSKTFNLPASKSNNKVFKHYYDFDIVGGFDARLKVNATLEINNLPYKKGKLLLNGTTIKNGEINTYKVTFFGNTVELKDLVGDDDLQDLPLNDYNDVYSATRVRQGLQRTLGNNLIVPLITHSQRLYYDSGEDVSNSGNLYYSSGGGVHMHGVKWTELKYALRVNKIIEAIEERYSKPAYPVNLRFSTDFFKDTTNDRFNSLFMWLHRKSGDVENFGSSSEIESIIDNFNVGQQGEFVMFDGNLTSGSIQNPSVNLETFRLDLNVVGDNTDEYKIRVTRNATTVFESDVLSGDEQLNLDSIYENNASYQVFVSSAYQIPFTTIEWNIAYYDRDDNGDEEEVIVFYFTPTFTTSLAFQFIISQQIPEMKVIDFLTGLFKMFNLTAFVDEAQSDEDTTFVRVKTLNSFYSDPTISTFDISEFVDVGKKDVDAALPYKQINLEYKDTKTFLANKFKQIANKEWGGISYSTNEPELAGRLYNIKVPFSHMQFERITNADNNTLRPLQWGYSVNESQNAYKGPPVLFYPVRQSSGIISFINNIDDNGDFTGKESVNTLNMPSNSLSFNPVTSKQNINFENEINEYTGTTEFTDTLFKDFYKDYLVDTFSLKRRITKVTAYLPLRIFTKFELNDIIIINQKKYIVNTMTTNLITGKTDLELLNIV
jgi:hypothetical protein